MGIGSIVREAAQEVDQHYRDLATRQLNADETLLSFNVARTRPPFWVRVLPFVPDLWTRGKLYLWIVTDQRFVVMRLTFPLTTRLPSVKALVASIGVGDIEEVSAGKAKLSIRTRANKERCFKDWNRSAPRDALMSLEAAKAALRGPTPAPELATVTY